jgi:hypothetical protein
MVSGSSAHPPAKAKETKQLFFLENSDCGVFSWHTVDTKLLAKAKPLIAEAKLARQSCWDWSTLEWLETGFHIRRKVAGNYAAGYAWFARTLGDLNTQKGNNAEWCVIGHDLAYDSGLWAAYCGSVQGEASTADASDHVTKAASVNESDHQSHASGDRLAAAKRYCLAPALKLLSLAASPEVDSRYELLEELDKGTFGSVF